MPPDGSIFERRRSNLSARFAEFGVDALLLLGQKNIRYLTGFTGDEAVLFLTGRGAVLVVDGRFTTQAKGEVAGPEILECRDRVEAIRSVLAKDGIETVGFESAVMTVDLFDKLNDGGLAGIVLKPLSEKISDIRIIKDEGEIAKMRRAAAIAREALLAVRDRIEPGVSERELALELEYRMRQGGAEGVSFPSIVASGANSALPHATPQDRRIERGDALVIDFGAVHEGYHSDETWTSFIGEAGDRQREVYGLVKEAHDRALDAVRAGVPCSEVDRVARGCIEDRGMGAYFSHGTGHGVGLDVHEAPRLAAGSERILEAGMVITVEPGVYIPGLWGIRIEDMVLVQEDGCEVLTGMSKALTLI
ncbi:MAG: aminopeptidase P family protein [Deltaproteobacteria bacterium]|nr:aminopeptidase P family protein [Deltaproteobacteria bacterium]